MYKGKPLVSIIIPIKNEEENVVPIIKQIQKAMEVQQNKYEILFIDDHSTDNSVSIIQENNDQNTCSSTLKKSNPTQNIIKVFRLSEKYGKEEGLRRGFEEALGDIIVTMDGDLQNDPSDIPSLINQMEYHDIICGIRQARNDTFIRILVSRIANMFRNWAIMDSIKDAGCGIQAMKRACSETILKNNYNLYGIDYLFYPAILKMHGYKVKQIPVAHHPRLKGRSKFGVIRGRLVTGIRACLKLRKIIKNHTA